MAENSYKDWEYARLGDYHRNLDPNWSYTPTYLKKMSYVHNFIDGLPKNARILDAGCGEGVLVEEYSRKGRLIEGIDINYSSKYVRQGTVTAMPYENHSFDVVLLLDVFEHIPFADQPKALQEIGRVLKNEGSLLLSIPNLAHLTSRFRFFFRGELDRSDIEINHVSERPLNENKKVLMENGFIIEELKGITLTIPFIYRGVICKKPAQYRWLHDLLDYVAIPKYSMLNMFKCRAKREGE